jgi:hypothetical protein
MRLGVKRVAVVVGESGCSEKSETAKLQLLIGQGNALWNRHFLIHLPRMSRYRPSYLLFPVTKVPEVICEKEATQMHEDH